MADLEQIKILKQGLDAWNKWREENDEIIPYLKKCEPLQGAPPECGPQRNGPLQGKP
jgi:hypothetical protein